MAGPLFPAFRAWRAACERAMNAEAFYFDAQVRHAKGVREAPSAELVAQAHALRAEASRLFTAAMREAHAVNESAAELVQRMPLPRSASSPKLRGHDAFVG